MDVRPLPSRPSLEHYRKQAKALHRALAERDETALEALARDHPRFRRRPPAEIDVKAPPLPPRKSESRPSAADIKPIPQSKPLPKSEPVVETPSMIQRAEVKRLADADAVLKAAGITGFTPVKPLGSGATANVCLCERD